MSTTLEVAIFLSLNGRAAEAIRFYEQHFNAERLLVVTYDDLARMGDSTVTEHNRSLIAHSVLRIGKTKVMMAEEHMDPAAPYRVGNQLSLCLQSADLAEIEAFYASAVTDSEVKVIVPLGANLFSEAYGIIEDPFGVHIQFMFDKRLRE